MGPLVEIRAVGANLTWRELTPFGVEIDGDLCRPFSTSEIDELRALFRDHALILARGQSLAMERQRRLCALFGPILLREGEDGTMTNEGGGPNSSELRWHSDAAYTAHPFDALSLHALDVVDGASSTRFTSAQLAFDTLPTSLRDALANREQEMIAPHYTMLAERTCDRRDPEAQKRGVMPAIYVNPHNGRRCVWVNEMQTSRLLGMSWEHSRALLHEVYDHLYSAANVLEHRWRNGDVIVWDNVALQHARGNLDRVGKRLLQRVIVGSEGVAPHVAG
jgi:alpha-ketoglutarate-dependent taurine dioxygenase